MQGVQNPKNFADVIYGRPLSRTSRSDIHHSSKRPSPYSCRKRYPNLFTDEIDREEDEMQRTNPSVGGNPEPGVNDDLVHGRSRCTGDPDMYYDQRCFEFDGSGNAK